VTGADSGALLFFLEVTAVALTASGQSLIIPRGTVVSASNDSVSFGSILFCFAGLLCFAGFALEEQQ
jgi:hypothetical protein